MVNMKHVYYSIKEIELSKIQNTVVLSMLTFLINIVFNCPIVSPQNKLWHTDNELNFSGQYNAKIKIQTCCCRLYPKKDAHVAVWIKELCV